MKSVEVAVKVALAEPSQKGEIYEFKQVFKAGVGGTGAGKGVKAGIERSGIEKGFKAGVEKAGVEEETGTGCA